MPEKQLIGNTTEYSGADRGAVIGFPLGVFEEPYPVVVVRKSFRLNPRPPGRRLFQGLPTLLNSTSRMGQQPRSSPAPKPTHDRNAALFDDRSQ